MQVPKLNRFSINFFWLSIVFHLALLLFFVKYQPISVPVTEPTYYYYEPPKAYLRPMLTDRQMPSINQSLPEMEERQQYKFSAQNDVEAIPIRKPLAENVLKRANLHNEFIKPIQSYQRSNDASSVPLKMIGDKLLDDPVRKLLGRAIMSHLYYPNLARERYRRGIVSIGFILHPSGEIRGAHIVRTSKEKSLDLSALDAVNEASPVANIDVYVKEAKYWIVNIIF